MEAPNALLGGRRAKSAYPVAGKALERPSKGRYTSHKEVPSDSGRFGGVARSFLDWLPHKMSENGRFPAGNWDNPG